VSAAWGGTNDIHKNTAARMFGVPVEEVTDAMRRQAKRRNFLSLYGIHNETPEQTRALDALYKEMG
jgi:DNA polymerase I-like protein with 3'-5' exonuclease and polymerase domains